MFGTKKICCPGKLIVWKGQPPGKFIDQENWPFRKVYFNGVYRISSEEKLCKKLSSKKLIEEVPQESLVIQKSLRPESLSALEKFDPRESLSGRLKKISSDRQINICLHLLLELCGVPSLETKKDKVACVPTINFSSLFPSATIIFSQQPRCKLSVTP